MSDTYFEVSDVLGCVGSDLIDVARRVAEFPPDLQAAAAAVELDAIHHGDGCVER